MTRLWYKDGTYMDVRDVLAREYEQDPEWDHSESIGPDGPIGADAEMGPSGEE